MDRSEENVEYWEILLGFLDKLLYTAFLLKKENDYENLPMRGVVITEKEVDQAFSGLYESAQVPDEILKDLAAQEQEIRAVEKEAGESLLFFSVCKDFRLTKIECLALLLSAAPCFNRKYERIYGYLQDRVDLFEPTRGLCISLAELLEEDGTPEISDFLAGKGNLGLLLEHEKDEKGGLASPCVLKPGVRDFLYGSEELSVGLRKQCFLFLPSEKTEPLLIREEYRNRLCRLWDSLTHRENGAEAEPCMVLLCGKRGIGKKFMLKQMASEKQERLLFTDISGLLYEKEETVYRMLEAVYTEAVLLRAQIVLCNGDVREKPEEAEIYEERQDRRKEILNWLKKRKRNFFFLAEEIEQKVEDFAGKTVILEFPSLTAGEKAQLWKAYGTRYRLAPDVDPGQMGNKYILTPREIQNVLHTAGLLAGMEDRTVIEPEQIRQAVRQNQNKELGTYATRLDSRFVWDDLILGEEPKKQMRMVCNQMKYRDVVGEQWGFHKKTPYGRGLSVLFYGPPGTGKTMAAQVMANELGLDLFRIDISQMVSKYIGETQKNISRLFEKAKDINAVLFFDEADSLFAKRSEAKDSHDRNANAETAHLLQKLEDYEGIAILATNYLNNIDDAFKRRLKFIIHIAFPEPCVRLRLWQTTLPAETQCEEELDFEFFAEHFELSGSSIKEILTNAAYLAASEQRGLKNCDIVEAVKLNYAKYGKILTRNDFGYLSV